VKDLQSQLPIRLKREGIGGAFTEEEGQKAKEPINPREEKEEMRKPKESQKDWTNLKMTQRLVLWMRLNTTTVLASSEKWGKESNLTAV